MNLKSFLQWNPNFIVASVLDHARWVATIYNKCKMLNAPEYRYHFPDQRAARFHDKYKAVLEQPTELMLAPDEDNKTTQYLMEFHSSPFYC